MTYFVKNTNRYCCMFIVIKTKQGLFPVFFFPKNESLVTFKVKASQEAHIILSEYGSLYARSRFFKVLNLIVTVRNSSKYSRSPMRKDKGSLIFFLVYSIQLKCINAHLNRQ